MKKEDRVEELEKKIERLENRNLKLKKLEEDLKNSEERLKILFEHAPDGYFLCTLRGDFIDGNKAAEEIIGYKREELIGKNILKLSLVSADQFPRVLRRLGEHAFGRATEPGEFVLNKKNSEKIPVEISANVVKISGQTLVLGLVRDIRERKEAEEELRRKNEELEKINKLAIGREMTMVDLKKKIKDLENQLDKEGKSF